jgi:hypothetical protein
VTSVDKEIVEQLCDYFGLGTVESFRPVAFQAHFAGVGRITRATPKYRRDVTNHVYSARLAAKGLPAAGRRHADNAL